jgi:hypothetical protein
MDTIAFDPSAATLVNVLTCDPKDQPKLLDLLRENIDTVITSLDGWRSTTLFNVFTCGPSDRPKPLDLFRENIERIKQLVRSATYLICFIIGFSFWCAPATAQTEAGALQMRDGQHDFDFHFGSWHTHVRILINPLTGSKTWVESDGTVTVRKIWDGLGNLEEIEASNATTHFKGLTLFLYNPKAHQWSQTSANMNDGSLSTPLIGEFKNGRGEFYDQETYNGRSILVRFVWSDITADSHRIEQSYSADGGKTWEPNLVANLTREKE